MLCKKCIKMWEKISLDKGYVIVYIYNTRKEAEDDRAEDDRAEDNDD